MEEEAIRSQNSEEARIVQGFIHDLNRSREESTISPIKVRETDQY